MAQLEEQLNTFFKEKLYGHRLAKIYCTIICVSQDFDALIMARPPRWGRKDPYLEVEVKIDFDTYTSMDGNEVERLQYITLKCYETIPAAFISKPLKGFDKATFLNDLKNCLYKAVLPLA